MLEIWILGVSLWTVFLTWAFERKMNRVDDRLEVLETIAANLLKEKNL